VLTQRGRQSSSDQGRENAGHNCFHWKTEISSASDSSGILRKGKSCGHRLWRGGGSNRLVSEIDGLLKLGVAVTAILFISERRTGFAVSRSSIVSGAFEREEQDRHDKARIGRLGDKAAPTGLAMIIWLIHRDSSICSNLK